MKFSKYNLLFESEKLIYKNLIYESVFVYDVFKDILSNLKIRLLKGEIIDLKYDDLMSLLPKNWKYTKYLKRNKRVLISLCSKFNKKDYDIELTNEEILDINLRIRSTKGFFVSDFEKEKNVGILIINSDIDEEDFIITLMHEMIYFFQWNTEKSIKEYLIASMISEDDKNMIEKKLNIFKEDLEYFLTSSEKEAFYNTLFYSIKSIFKPLTRTMLKKFIDAFSNYGKFNNFLDYYLNVKYLLKLMNLNLDTLKNYEGMALILVVGYSSIGFSQLKNHLLGYFDTSYLKAKAFFKK